MTHHLIDIQDYPPGEPQLDDNFIHVQAEISAKEIFIQFGKLTFDATNGLNVAIHGPIDKLYLGAVNLLV